MANAARQIRQLSSNKTFVTLFVNPATDPAIVIQAASLVGAAIDADTFLIPTALTVNEYRFVYDVTITTTIVPAPPGDSDSSTDGGLRALESWQIGLIVVVAFMIGLLTVTVFIIVARGRRDKGVPSQLEHSTLDAPRASRTSGWTEVSGTVLDPITNGTNYGTAQDYILPYDDSYIGIVSTSQPGIGGRSSSSPLSVRKISDKSGTEDLSTPVHTLMNAVWDTPQDQRNHGYGMENVEYSSQWGSPSPRPTHYYPAHGLIDSQYAVDRSRITYF